MKNATFLSLIIVFLLIGCEKKYNLDDISTFEFNYNTGSGWTGYFYNLQLKETGVLDIQFRRTLTDDINRSIYSVSKSDLVEFKPYLVNLLTSDINANYGVSPGQITDQAAIGIIFKANNKQVVTSMYGATDSELPESLRHIMERVSVLQLKYDTLIKH